MQEDINNYRITKLRQYMIDKVINKLTDDEKYQINADMLSKDTNNYSLDKIPTQSTIRKWIFGTKVHRDVYLFRSRMFYSQDVVVNLSNIGFFENLEALIETNNEQGILPEIENVESIECLNCGSMQDNDTNTAEFSIQIQVTYRNNGTKEIVSL